ncbi:MAG: hypothetical protein V1885_00680 [Candidatus Brennerbacteria bacterium]
MQGKVITALVGLLIIAVLLYVLLSSLAPIGRSPATGEVEGISAPRGPVGDPFVNGPIPPPPEN